MKNIILDIAAMLMLAFAVFYTADIIFLTSVLPDFLHTNAAAFLIGLAGAFSAGRLLDNINK